MSNRVLTSNSQHHPCQRQPITKQQIGSRAPKYWNPSSIRQQTERFNKNFWATFLSVAESLGISIPTFTQCAPKATKFAEMMQSNGHYDVQGHPRSLIFMLFESSYNFQSAINTNVPPMLHRVRDMASDRSKIAIFGYPCCV